MLPENAWVWCLGLLVILAGIWWTLLRRALRYRNVSVDRVFELLQSFVGHSMSGSIMFVETRRKAGIAKLIKGSDNGHPTLTLIVPEYSVAQARLPEVIERLEIEGIAHKVAQQNKRAERTLEVCRRAGSLGDYLECLKALRIVMEVVGAVAECDVVFVARMSDSALRSTRAQWQRRKVGSRKWRGRNS